MDVAYRRLCEMTSWSPSWTYDVISEICIYHFT